MIKRKVDYELVFWIVVTVLVLASCFFFDARANGQGVSPLAYAEIQERGDWVEVPGNYGQSLSPPPSDANKWFVTVLASRSCGPCKRLLYDVETSKYLKPYKVWAHYNVFYAEDKTQDWRWRHINVRAYPTILIQPPRSEQFGDPATVVLQLDGYDGNPARLAHTIRAGIVRYIAKYDAREQLFPRPFRPRPQPVVQPSPGPDNVDVPLDPPFEPPTPTPTPLPKIDEPPPLPEIEPVPDTVLVDEPSISVNKDIVMDAVRWLLENGDSGTLTNLLALIILYFAFRQGKAASIKKVVDTYLEAKTEINRASQRGE